MLHMMAKLLSAKEMWILLCISDDDILKKKIIVAHGLLFGDIPQLNGLLFWWATKRGNPVCYILIKS